MERLTEAQISELVELCPGGLYRDVDLSQLSKWRIGGNADLILRPASSEEVVALMKWFHWHGLQPLIIGLTSNLLFDDKGLRAPCIQIGPRMSRIFIEGHNVRAQAGVWVPGLARCLMQAGLGGASHICGIPGTLGGLICMNGGSQRKGIGSSVVLVESVDRQGEICRRSAEACNFGYRQSVFQVNGELITFAEMAFTPCPIHEIRSEMRAILADRRMKFPRKEPNCGSVFKSNPDMYDQLGPPGVIIERLGLKGLQIGEARVSPQHANFIVNTGNATARDTLELINTISSVVEDATGFRMKAEIYFVNTDGVFIPADEVQVIERIE